MPGVVLEDTDRTLPARELCPRRAGASPNSTTFCGFLMAKVLNRYRKINRDLARGRELNGRRDGRRDPERDVPGRRLGREPAESRSAHFDGSRAGPDGEIALGRNLEEDWPRVCRRPCHRAVSRVVRRDPPADREPELRIRRAAGLGHRDLPPPGLAQQACARPAGDHFDRTVRMDQAQATGCRRGKLPQEVGRAPGASLAAAGCGIGASASANRRDVRALTADSPAPVCAPLPRWVGASAAGGRRGSGPRAAWCPCRSSPALAWRRARPGWIRWRA